LIDSRLEFGSGVLLWSLLPLSEGGRRRFLLPGCPNGDCQDEGKKKRLHVAISE
jgi:hypothetical protein